MRNRVCCCWWWIHGSANEIFVIRCVVHLCERDQAQCVCEAPDDLRVTLHWLTLCSFFRAADLFLLFSLQAETKRKRQRELKWMRELQHLWQEEEQEEHSLMQSLLFGRVHEPAYAGHSRTHLWCTGSTSQSFTDRIHAIQTTAFFFKDNLWECWLYICTWQTTEKKWPWKSNPVFEPGPGTSTAETNATSYSHSLNKSFSYS